MYYYLTMISSIKKEETKEIVPIVILNEQIANDF
jgi:hypothetical protein